MLNHLLILETKPGGGDVLRAAAADWDARGEPVVVSLPAAWPGAPRHSCHAVYQLLAERIKAFLTERQVRTAAARPVIVVDAIEWIALNPLSTAPEYRPAMNGTIIARLILSFPEVLWGFAHQFGEEAMPERVGKVHDFTRWVAAGHVPPVETLLDPTGLRDHVRQRARITDKKQTGEFEPSWALAMDDESAFAYFNAYVQYRFGLCALPVASLAAAEFSLQKDSPPPALSFEDLYISFPDVPENWDDEPSDPERREDDTSILPRSPAKVPKLSNLDDRKERLTLLDKGLWRVIVTSGAGLPKSALDHLLTLPRYFFPDCKWWRLSSTAKDSLQKESFIEEQLATYGARRTFKPVAGMFDLWHREVLEPAAESGGSHAFQFRTGYMESKTDGATGGQHRHSAPGAKLAVATALLDRARRLRDGFGSVEDFIFGAVLATDALELLENRTPTLSLDALVMKHEFEVRAECQFSGVQSHPDVRRRLDEIRRFLEKFATLYHPSRRRLTRWNGEAAVLLRLKAILNEHEQFEEEEAYAIASRDMHRRLRYDRSSGKWLPRRLVGSGSIWYFNKLLQGRWLLTSIVFWLCALSIGFYFCERNAEVGRASNRELAKQQATQQQQMYSALVTAGSNAAISTPPVEPGGESQVEMVGNAVVNAVSTFVSVGAPFSDPAKDCSLGFRYFSQIISCVGMALGFVHLGIFIAYLYSVVVRKK